MPSVPRNVYHKKVVDDEMAGADVTIFKNVFEHSGLPIIGSTSYEVSYRVRVCYDEQVRSTSVKSISDAGRFIAKTKKTIDKFAGMENVDG